MPLREAGINSFEEVGAHIGYYILGERGVEPDLLFAPISFARRSDFGRGVIHKGVLVS